jgi:hypothetical protein
MMNERTVLVLLEGEVTPDALCSQQLKQALQHFANQTLRFFEEGKMEKFKTNLSVAMEFFQLGNDIVKEAVLTIYLDTLSKAFTKYEKLSYFIKRALPREMKSQYPNIYYRYCA